MSHFPTDAPCRVVPMVSSPLKNNVFCGTDRKIGPTYFFNRLSVSRWNVTPIETRAVPDDLTVLKIVVGDDVRGPEVGHAAVEV